MSERVSVADYIVGRLAREGITDCFGVPGDFAFKLCDAVARSEAIRWIGCSNELDAAYATDGYARVRGCSMLLTTYAVGELSAPGPGQTPFGNGCFSQPRVLGSGGVVATLQPALSTEENEAMKQSAQVLQKARQALELPS
jgi:malate/lactate dehydrogenase